MTPPEKPLPPTTGTHNRILLSDLRARAESGDAQAQNILGVCFTTGQDIPKNEAEAVKWFRRAAEQNHPAAQHNLGTLYSTGEGKDVVEALKWYLKAAEQGYAESQLHLAYHYATGKGVRPNGIEALKWTILAAAHGSESAKSLLPMIEKQLLELQIAEGRRRANEWLEMRKTAPRANSR